MGDVHAELTRALRGSFTLPLAVDLARPHRFIILSDQHKGAGDRADEFVRCKAAYHAALRHYSREGFTLVLLGDVEELWEQSFGAVETAHADSLRLEASFAAGRYYRVWGNHDDAWMDAFAVRRRLRRYMPTDAVYEGIRFEFFSEGRTCGTMMCVHGHQGTLGSDKIREVSRVFVRLWRHVQRFSGIGQTTPSKDACLRGRHDRTMYEWAAVQDCLILVAGHTHRPVWSSQTHLQILETQLARLEGMDEADASAAERLALEEAIAERRAKNPPCNDTEKAIPCYFNTGCCKYRSGNITGIELVDGELRLVRWRRENETREVLESVPITDVFDQLRAVSSDKTHS